MSTIEEFIEARIDIEEATARGTVQASLSWQNFTMDGELRDSDNAGTIMMCVADEDRQHIAHHDPARVLRQCTALRAILRVHRPDGDRECVGCTRNDRAGEPSFVPIGECVELRTLAAIWPDHPDFQAEWVA
ncbi:DUF6221 family protein [Nocardia sp. NBC_01327]|uniref:DUF6221 family protein n=1 Tax=Nocardia sp. NBC_01327 TaxID=2903593 RepID=UPI002E141BA3|nr:DUF6221 family protein [Nocardia sp. NBC_01327]